MTEIIPYRIRCSEIWGGVSNTNSDVCTRGINASIYAVACDADQGGDIYYLAVCSGDLLTRIVIADVRGYGAPVAQIGQWVYEGLGESMNTLDGTIILEQLNRLIHAHGIEAMTTAVVVGFYVQDFGLSICYGGHPPVLLRRHTYQANWERVDPPPSSNPTNLPLDVLPGTRYEQILFPLRSGDRIALYTDGVTECESSDGSQLGVEGLCGVLQRQGTHELSAIKQGVLDGLLEYADRESHEDDLTLLLMEIR
jgi:serine phosphatase RsbU (regulator of sigma subunit)